MGENIKINKRLEQNYVEALALMGDLKTVYQKAVVVAEHLINGVAKRIEWGARENERRSKESMARGLPPPPPIVTVAELECLGRIVTALQNSRPEALNPDHDAGVREIVRVLEEARREFRNNERESNATPEGAEEAPEDVKEEFSEEFKQRHGIHAPSTDGHRRNEHRQRQPTSAVNS